MLLNEILTKWNRTVQALGELNQIRKESLLKMTLLDFILFIY